MPKATSSPSISDEQKERMIRNRRLAEERRLARLKQNSSNNLDSSNINIDLTAVDNVSNNTSNVRGDVTEVNDVIINNIDTRNVLVDATKDVSNSESNLDVRAKTRNYQVDLTEVDDISGTEIRRVTLNGHVDLTGVTDNSNSESNLQKRQRILTTNGEVKSTVDVDLTEEYEIGNRSAKDSVTHEKDTVDLTEVNVIEGHKKAEVSDTAIEDITDITVDITENINNAIDDKNVDVFSSKKQEKTNVIDSSDKDCDMEALNAAAPVDIHKNGDKNGVSKETEAAMNDIDSSDDEQDLRVVNESVTVDIHNDASKDRSELHNKSVDQVDKEMTSGVQKDDCNKVSGDNMIVGDDDIMEVDFGDDF